MITASRVNADPSTVLLDLLLGASISLASVSVTGSICSQFEDRESASLDRLLHEGFERQRDTLAATDAEGDDAAFQAVALHRMKQSGGQHRSGRADRVAVRYGAALDVDDVLGEAKFALDRNSDGGERLVDLDAVDVADRPARPRERLPDRRNRTQAEHAGLDRADAVRD